MPDFHSNIFAIEKIPLTQKRFYGQASVETKRKSENKVTISVQQTYLWIFYEIFL